MNDLTPQARAILDAVKGADSPSRADRARIKRGVLLHMAVLGATATATGGAAAMSLAAKLTLVGVTVAAIGGGAISVWKWREAPEISAPAPHPQDRSRRAPAHTTPIAPEEQRPEVEPAEEQMPSPTAPEPKRNDPVKALSRRSAAPVKPAEAAPTVPHAPLDPELTVLRQAQADLRAGLPAQALRRLQEFDRQFGPGSLEQERRAIMAIAHCQLSPGAAANARAKAFLQSTPDSPLAARVRAACDETTAPRR